MRPEIMDWITIPIRGGTIRFALMKTWADTWHKVGELEVPSPMIVELREPDEPAVDITIEVINQVPRVTDFRVTRVADGREVRQRDLVMSLEDLVEQAVAIASGRRHPNGGSHFPGGLPEAERPAAIRRGIAEVRGARARRQREMTPARLGQIADIYLAQDTRGIEAVAEVYNVHRATAARWVAKAREAGVLPERAEES